MSPDRRRHRTLGPGRRAVVAICAVAVTALLPACAGEPAAEVDPGTYRAAMNDVCAESRLQQAALVDPVDPAGATRFAEEVATLLAADAAAYRAITPPAEIAADHRAFVQNVDDEAGRWTELAATPPDDVAAYGALQTEILELGLGRDDLSAEMGLVDCARRAP